MSRAEADIPVRARSPRAERLFDVPADYLIAFARLSLATFALVAICLDPTQPARNADAAYLSLAAYTVYAAGYVALTLQRLPGLGGRLGAHVVDVATASALLYLTDGPTSPFFAFFTFVLFSGTLHWNWRGALITAGVLFLLFLAILGAVGAGSSQDVDELARTVVRSGYLLVAGMMLAYVGAYRARSRTRLTQLVTWPGPQRDAGQPSPTANALAHVAALMCARGVLVLWEDTDEPFRHRAAWMDGRVTYGKQEYGVLRSPVEPADFRGRIDPPSATLEENGGPRIDPALARALRADKILTAPFALPLCAGRVFLLDPKNAGDDELLMTDLIAMRIGVDLEHDVLRSRLQAAAAASERVRLARDLHDGVLQTLTAANLHLKLAVRDAPGGLGERLEVLRGAVVEEQRRLRGFVEENRARRPAAAKVPLAGEVRDRIAKLQRLWGCVVRYAESPPGLATSPALARHVRHLVAEAVSNAARHGQARRVDVSAAHAPQGGLEVIITDDGRGFPEFAGQMDGATLRARRAGPRSVQARVEELGGLISLRTGPDGSHLRIYLPDE